MAFKGISVSTVNYVHSITSASLTKSDKVFVSKFSKFQIKASGSNVNPNPTLTFTLKSKNGLEIDFSHDHGETGEFIPMLPLSEGTGKWIQVKIQLSLFFFNFLGKTHFIDGHDSF